MRLIHELRCKCPGLAAKRDKGWAMAAIRLFCLECMGGAPCNVLTCACTDCPLWILRAGSNPLARRAARIDFLDQDKLGPDPDPKIDSSHGDAA